MTISLTQAILLGLCCGIAKCCIPYTAGAFMYNTVIFNAVIVGAVLGDMPHAMMIGASLQLIYLGVIAAGGNQPTDPCLAAYVEYQLQWHQDLTRMPQLHLQFQ